MFKKRKPQGKQHHLSIMIDAELHEKLQLKRIKEQKSIGKIVEDILREKLGKTEA